MKGRIEKVRIFLLAVCAAGMMLNVSGVCAGDLITPLPEDPAADSEEAEGDGSDDGAEEAPCGILVVENRGEMGKVEILFGEEPFLMEKDYLEEEVPMGTVCRMAVHPDSRYLLDEVSVNGGKLLPDAENSFVMVMDREMLMVQITYKANPEYKEGVQDPSSVRENVRPPKKEKDPSDGTSASDISYDIVSSRLSGDEVAEIGTSEPDDSSYEETFDDLSRMYEESEEAEEDPEPVSRDVPVTETEPAAEPAGTDPAPAEETEPPLEEDSYEVASAEKSMDLPEEEPAAGTKPEEAVSPAPAYKVSRGSAAILIISAAAMLVFGVVERKRFW